MPAATAPEAAVRRYLAYLADPSSAVDTERLGRLQRELASATDPIDRLRLLAEIHQCRTPDAAQLRAAFVEHAKQWADGESIPPEAFAQLGVSDADLRAAGWTVRRRSADATPTERGGVTVAEIETYILRQRSAFTVADIAAGVGGSPMTLRKAIGNLLAQGTITRLAPAAPRGRGRSPSRYQVTPERAARRGK